MAAGNALDIPVRPNLRPYEAVILMHPDASDEEQKNLFRKNKGIIESMFKGTVNHLDTWGKRSLANPIEKCTRAIYFHTTFTAEPAAIAELERTMRINDRVLRFQHSALDVRTNLTKFVEDFKQALADAAAREREREAKFQARKAARMGGREGGHGGGFGRDRDHGGRDMTRKDDARQFSMEEDISEE